MTQSTITLSLIINNQNAILTIKLTYNLKHSMPNTDKYFHHLVILLRPFFLYFICFIVEN